MGVSLKKQGWINNHFIVSQLITGLKKKMGGVAHPSQKSEEKQ